MSRASVYRSRVHTSTDQDTQHCTDTTTHTSVGNKTRQSALLSLDLSENKPPEVASHASAHSVPMVTVQDTEHSTDTTNRNTYV